MEERCRAKNKDKEEQCRIKNNAEWRENKKERWEMMDWSEKNKETRTDDSCCEDTSLPSDF